MRPATSESFGLLIAYMIPGLVVLWGLSQPVPELNSWIGTDMENCQSMGGFLNLTVASVGAGLTASTVRWLLIDTLHYWTGIQPSNWNLRNLHARTSAFEIMIEIHYRYYQFYANSLIAIIFSTTGWWVANGFRWPDLAIVIPLLILFFVGSRDTLTKYYARTGAMLEQ
jgi:hypothetical protein